MLQANRLIHPDVYGLDTTTGVIGFMPKTRTRRHFSYTAPPVSMRFAARKTLERIHITPVLTKADMRQTEPQALVSKQAIWAITSDLRQSLPDPSHGKQAAPAPHPKTEHDHHEIGIRRKVDGLAVDCGLHDAAPWSLQCKRIEFGVHCKHE
ncbi:hypothetical protein P5689_08145 [Asaia sp. HumB]|nr:hypothetical protein [Asaia sp. HumB]MDL2171135.1 hypothetical protein [Asaia sp. HumB]